jgi:UDP-glucose 4-epimerase
MKKKDIIVVIGSTGFIGKNISETLKNKREYKLVNISSKDCNLLNITEVKNILQTIQPQYIVNAAFIGVDSSREYSDEYFYNNLKIVTNIINASRELKFLKKLIFLGSGLEYGDSKIAISEKKNSQPKNMYAIIKSVTSQVSLHLARKFELPLIVLKPFNLYGPYDTKGLFFYIISSIFKKKQITLSKGEQIRDYLYINDLAEIIYSCIKKSHEIPNYESYNVGSGTKLQLKNVYKTIFNLMNFSGQVHYKSYAPNDYMMQTADSRKLKKIITFPKQHGLEEGLKETIKWIKLHD